MELHAVRAELLLQQNSEAMYNIRMIRGWSDVSRQLRARRWFRCDRFPVAPPGARNCAVHIQFYYYSLGPLFLVLDIVHEHQPN